MKILVNSTLLTIIVMITSMSSVCGQDLLTLQTCKSLDSILIDCACESFLGDINEVISKIFNHYNSSEMKNSHIKDILSVATLTPLMTSIFPNALAICRNTSSFHNCLIERNFLSSNNLADVYTKYFFPEAGNVKNFVNDMCEMLHEIQPKVECVAEKVLPSVGCFTSRFNQLTGISHLNQSSPSFGTDLLALICPFIGDLGNCMRIQVFPCGENISTGITKMVQSTSPTCVDKLSEGKKSPLSSVLINCGLGIYPEIHNFSISQADSSRFRSMIDAMCRIAPYSLQCVVRELPNSNNNLDVNLIEMVDFSQFSESIIRPFCDRKQELTDVIMCMMNMAVVEKLAKCVHPNITGPFASADFSAQVFNGSYIRSQFCTPFHDGITCILDIMNSTCSTNMARLFHALFLQLLRLDCYGSRSSVFSTNIFHDTTTSIHSTTTADTTATVTGTESGDAVSGVDATSATSSTATTTGADPGDAVSSTDAITTVVASATTAETKSGGAISGVDATSTTFSVATTTGAKPGDAVSSTDDISSQSTHTDVLYTTTAANSPTHRGNDSFQGTSRSTGNSASSFNLQLQKTLFAMICFFFVALVL